MSNTELRTKLEIVTPVLAAEWLEERNIGNRPLSQHVVQRYAQDMRDGLWMLTHQGPAFATDGRLIDGQHRIAAVREADMDVPMHVTYGADPETFTVLDISYRRAPAHLIPGPNASTKAGAARLLTAPPRLFRDNRAHNRDIVRIVDEHPAMDAGAALSMRVYSAIKINSSVHTALLVLALESPLGHLVDEWVRGLETGAGLGATDPRLVLRNRWALEATHLNSGAGRAAGIFLLVRAWNAYARGEEMARLVLPKKGPRLSAPEVYLGTPTGGVG